MNWIRRLRYAALAGIFLAGSVYAQSIGSGDNDGPDGDFDEDDMPPPADTTPDAPPPGPTFNTTSGNPLLVDPLDQYNRQASSVGDPVDVSTGAENFSLTLISVHGLRDLAFTVHHNSLQVLKDSDLGYGWTHAYGAIATGSSDGSTVTIKWSPAHSNVYKLDTSAGAGRYRSADDAAYYDILQKNSNHTYTLVSRDKTTYSFDASGRLVQDKNRFGQVININYASSGSNLLSTMVEPVSGAILTFTYDANQHITQVADNAGRSISLSYDNVNKLLTERTDLNGNKIKYSYYPNLQLDTTTATDGVAIHKNSYDKLVAIGRVAKQDDGISTNRLMELAYDETSKIGSIITKVTDRRGGVSTYEHDAGFHLVSKTDALNRTITMVYDNHGNRTEVHDALGRVQKFTYDAAGNVVSSTDPVGNQTTFTYDAQNNPLTITNAAGQTATFKYDANNNPIESVDFAGNKTTRTYDSNSELTSATSPRGNVTRYSYTNGLLASVTDALENTTRFAFDAAGRLTSATDPASSIASSTYSPSGKVLSATDALGNRTTYVFDVRDRLVSKTDRVNGTTRYAYDNNDNLIATTDALGQVTSHAYDGEDRLIRTTDPLGHATNYSYDLAGQLVSVTDALGNTITFDHDAVGNRIASHDALNNTVLQTTYDARSLPTKLTDALARSTTQSFDVLARVTQRTDPLGQTTTLGYDNLNRLITATDPANQTSRQTFDADGNRSSLTDPGSNGLNFNYDADNRLISTASTGIRTTSYGYDARGLMTSVTDPSGNRTTLSYDANGRLSRWSDPVGQIDYGYDPKGRLTSVTEAGKTISRVYDALDRMVSFTDNAGNVIRYAYDATGNLSALTYPDGKKVTYTYDSANRLTGVTDWAGRAAQYTYDANGRLTKTVRPNGTQQTRAYDAAGQLTGLTDKAADGSVIVQYACTYDAAGRLSGETRAPAVPSFAPGAVQFTYGSDNRLNSVSGQSVSHDANGNLLTAPFSGLLSGLTYDARNRLISAGGQTYAYDAEGRRIQSTGSGGTTNYVIDPVAGLSRLFVTVGPSGSTTRFVYGLDALYQETDGTTVRYLHDDPRGNTVALSGSTGTVIGRIEYGPFGEVASRTGDTATSLLYCGKFGVQTDANNLLNMRARYYHPQLGRFVQQDSLLGAIDLAGALNRYAYANSNPFRFNDPLGLCAQNPSDSGGFWNGFGQGFANVFSSRNLLLTALTIAAPEVMIPALAIAGSFGAGYGLGTWANSGFAYNPNVAGNLAGSLAGSALLGGVGAAASTGAVEAAAAEEGAAASAESTVVSVATPYGTAVQADSAAVLAARSQVEDGATLYRLGTTGKSAASEAQFWSLEHPLSPGYAERYGIPPENVAAADFIETATLNPGATFITRAAPGVGPNGGGAIEAVVQPGGVTLQSFSTVTPGAPW